MKRYSKITIESYSGAKKYRWAINMFVIAICMSLFFGFISQTLLSSMGVIIASVCICIFIFLIVSSFYKHYNGVSMIFFNHTLNAND